MFTPCIFYNYNQMLTQIFKRFASTTKTYGNLKDSDRIFTNVYKDTDPYIKGALRRVKVLNYSGRLASYEGHSCKRSRLDHQLNQTFRFERQRRSWFPLRIKIFIHAQGYNQIKTQLSRN